MRTTDPDEWVDPSTWTLDDLARYLARKASVPEQYARDVVQAIFDRERNADTECTAREEQP